MIFIKAANMAIMLTGARRSKHTNVTNTRLRAVQPVLRSGNSIEKVRNLSSVFLVRETVCLNL